MDLQMGLAETMKNIAKGIQTEINNAPFNGVGYVTEKLYMLLQLYIQNKGWNPSVELLQCFTELKEASMLPSASYLQMLASRVTLDSQGRLILRENGKIILPYEHFANAVMLKHMNGPHGLHLNVEATVRAVMDSYTIGRDEFGMEKEFIVEVVQNCPNPTCRYYKTQLPSASSQSTPSAHSQSKVNNSSYINESAHSNKAANNSNVSGLVSNSTTSNTPLQTGSNASNQISSPPDLPTLLPPSQLSVGSNNNSTSLLSLPIDLTNVFEANLRSVMAASGAGDLSKLTPADLAKINVAELAKLNTAVKVGGGGRSGLSITRTSSNDILQQAIRNEAANNRRQQQQQQLDSETQQRQQQQQQQRLDNQQRSGNNNNTINSAGNTVHNMNSVGGNNNNNNNNNSNNNGLEDELSSVTAHKLSDFLKANIESLDSLNKDLLAAHNGTWGGMESPKRSGTKSGSNADDSGGLGQEKIVRAFSEIMKNMGRMKTCVRPSMCKPYGKQSESLQKTLVDTIQLVQTLRSFLPPPHIAVSSWKNEDKGNGGGGGNQGMGGPGMQGLGGLGNQVLGGLGNIQVSAASLAAAGALTNRKPPSGGMSLNTAAQIVSGSNLEELVEAVRAQQKAMGNSMD